MTFSHLVSANAIHSQNEIPCCLKWLAKLAELIINLAFSFGVQPQRTCTPTICVYVCVSNLAICIVYLCICNLYISIYLSNLNLKLMVYWKNRFFLFLFFFKKRRKNLFFQMTIFLYIASCRWSNAICERHAPSLLYPKQLVSTLSTWQPKWWWESLWMRPAFPRSRNPSFPCTTSESK